MSTNATASIEELHRIACSQGRLHYIDPATGYQVMTSTSHKRRGWCCGGGCRHCPFGHHNVNTALRTNTITEPIYLRASKRSSKGTCCDVVFFSGGKDSFLATLEVLRALQESGRSDKHVVLLTSFDPVMGKHGLQNVEISFIQDQAKQMGLDLIAVPVAKGRADDQGAGYLEAIQQGLQLVAPCRIERLVFGDLHLQHIRDWRESAFSGLGYQCHFPLWQKPMDQLLKLLQKSGARVTISAVQGPEVGVEIGDVFDADLVERLPEGVDAFGENGEFHTQVHVHG